MLVTWCFGDSVTQQAQIANLHHHHPFFNRTSVQPNHFSQYRINDQQHQHFADTMTILIFTGTVLLITIISNQPNQHHHYKINDQQHQQHCNLNLCRHSTITKNIINISIFTNLIFLISQWSWSLQAQCPSSPCRARCKSRRRKAPRRSPKVFFLAKITIVQFF